MNSKPRIKSRKLSPEVHIVFFQILKGATYYVQGQSDKHPTSSSSEVEQASRKFKAAIGVYLCIFDLQYDILMRVHTGILSGWQPQ